MRVIIKNCRQIHPGPANESEILPYSILLNFSIGRQSVVIGHFQCNRVHSVCYWGRDVGTPVRKAYQEGRGAQDIIDCFAHYHETLQRDSLCVLISVLLHIDISVSVSYIYDP